MENKEKTQRLMHGVVADREQMDTEMLWKVEKSLRSQLSFGLEAANMENAGAINIPLMKKDFDERYKRWSEILDELLKREQK